MTRKEKKRKKREAEEESGGELELIKTIISNPFDPGDN